MPESWIIAVPFVVGSVYIVVQIVMRANGYLDRRDAARRNHARPYPSRLRDTSRRVGRRG